MIILPSQARDKHRERMSKTEMRFSAESVVPYGLVASHWGGTMVEHWQPNSTLNDGVCKNNSGGAYLLRAVYNHRNGFETCVQIEPFQRLNERSEWGDHPV